MSWQHCNTCVVLLIQYHTIETYFFQNHRPVWAEIDLDCVAHNLREFQRILPPSTLIMAVLKADAYGHGAVEIAQTALESGASWLAIALPEEGVLLRRQGIAAPILLLGSSPPGTEAAIIANDLCPNIFTIESAQRFAECATSHGKTLPFHLKIDTGMGRIGVRPEQLQAFLDAVKALPQLELQGVFSHFSKADERDRSYSQKQCDRFQDCLTMIHEAGFRPQYRYLCNSAAAMDPPNTTHVDMVRIGIGMYGLYPSHDVDRTIVRLKTVLQWKARITHLKELPSGEAVSYGGKFITQRRTTVATLPLGYADGFRRGLWARQWQVLVRGQRAPLIGRICMDMCMIDVTDIDGVEINDEVVLLGQQGDEMIHTDMMAAALETINYEITCLIGKRVPRVYIKQGRVISVKSLLGTR
ncbi:alanine racemase [candidate division KSB3 bacterium]|uniref:Alanine racemase n=1 Tax=candidate division KSB3 bacterium TaxID=2044937 RepID=A0A2G6E956_9BACT|nr:MAG: alanine racemase [candidate division KSB3 bacterium]PIE29533.1 MAG: alanine racemase [candidate division KSB3 bacterium]